MTPKFYPVLEQCIETGLLLGWNRAHKHTDAPSPELIRDEQYTAIVGQMYEWFNFPEASAPIQCQHTLVDSSGTFGKCVTCGERVTL